jgi:hypothetical protein
MYMPAMYRKINMYMLEAVSYMFLSQLYTREWEIELQTLGTRELNTMTELTQFFSSILVGSGPSYFPCTVNTSLVVRISPASQLP